MSIRDSLRARVLLWVGAITLLLAPNPSAAQEVMEGALPDSIVVTASRTPDAVRLTGRRVTVWTAADIAALPVTSVDELLRTVGGVEAQSRGGFGAQSDLTMRGSTFNGVLLLLDGVRLNDPMTGHFLSDLPVPLAAIARVEVLRGPAAALYGPDALGGVIHLFTHVGLLRGADAPAGWAVQAEALGGEHALYDVEGAVRYGRGPTLVSAAIGAQGTDGEAIEGPSGVVVRSDGEAVRADLRRVAASAAVAHRPSAQTDLYVRAGVDDREFGAYHFYTAFASDTAREATTTLWLQSRLRGRLGVSTRWTVEGALKQHDDTYRFNPQSLASEHTSRLGLLQVRLMRLFSPRLTGTVGLAGSLRGIDSNVMQQHSDYASGAFAAFRWRPTPHWGINGGGRLDYDPSYGVEATPHLSVAYTRAAWTLRAAGSRAVRAPNYVERYLDAAGNVGNPDLDAERAWGGEVGADLYLPAGLTLHATAFARTTDNLIDYALVPGDSVFRARNIVEVDTRGLELDATADRRLGPASLRLTTTYTLLDADTRGRVPGGEYKYVLSSARHLVQGTATLGVRRTSVSLQGLWKDRRAADSYGVVHARLAHAIPLRQGRLQASVEVRNLFDVAYAEVFDAPMPGRWWMVGLAFRR